MARTLPAPANLVLPDPAKALPTLPVYAGSSSNPGHQLHFGQALNAAHATAQADTTWAQGWADGQFVVNDAVATERLRVRVPKCSDVHLDLLCSAHAYSHGAGTGVITWNCAGNGNTAAPALGGALALTGRATLDLTGGFVADAGGDYAELYVQTKNEVTLRGIWCQYADLAPGGLYPGADDALAAGPDGDFVPADDGEVAADRPTSSDWLKHRRASLAQLSTRIRSFYCWAGVQGAAGAALYQWPAPIRYSGVFPVMAGTDAGLRTLTLWARGVFTAASGELGVSLYDYATRRRLGGVTFAPSSGTTWAKATVRLMEQRSASLPPADYPGFMLCYLGFDGQTPAILGGEDYVVSYDATRCIDSVSVWGR